MTAPSRQPVGAMAVAVLLFAVALVVRIGVVVPDSPSLPNRLMAVLFAAAALCGAGLTIRRLPAIAWLTTASAAAIATVEIVAVARTSQPVAGAELRSWLAILSGIALVCGVGIAAAYAAHRRGSDGHVLIPRAATLLAGTAVVVGVVAAVWSIAAGAGDAGSATVDPAQSPARIAARLSLGLIAIGLFVGVGRDLSGPVGRALGRWRAPAIGSPLRRPSFLAALADELLPTRSVDRRRATESERARLAADLHAFVLPELRQAAAAADSSGVPPDVAARVRRSLEGIEQLMHERQSIVLEEFGLVAALEWLAERTEERSALRVELELDGDRVDDRSAVPGDVARVAFRVALLALDNVVRHAAAGGAQVRLRVATDGVQLSVTDDGSGPAPEGAPTGRGLADMRAEAATAGAALSISRLDAGTRVTLAWPAASPTRNHALAGTDLTARSDALAP